MRRIAYLLGAALMIASAAQGQTEDRKWAIGGHGGYNQYWGELGNSWYRVDQAAYGFGGISVSRFLTRHFDATVLLTRGELGYQFQSADDRSGFRMRLTTADLLGKYYFAGRERLFVPYVFAGAGLLFQRGVAGVSYERSRMFDVNIPLGIGVNIRLLPWMWLQIQETYRYTFADYVDYRDGGIGDLYVQHMAGLVFTLPKIGGQSEKSAFKVDDCKAPKKSRERQARKGVKTKAKMKPVKEKRARSED